MYAIVEIAGQQFKVEKDQSVFVHRLEGKVLLTDDKGKVTVGAPVIKGVKVQAEIVQHLKGDKVIVFKKKRRKGYKVRNGHRQYFTEITVKGIKAGAAPKAKPAAEKKEATEKKTTKKAAEKKEAK